MSNEDSAILGAKVILCICQCYDDGSLLLETIDDLFEDLESNLLVMIEGIAFQLSVNSDSKSSLPSDCFQWATITKDENANDNDDTNEPLIHPDSESLDLDTPSYPAAAVDYLINITLAHPALAATRTPYVKAKKLSPETLQQALFAMPEFRELQLISQEKKGTRFSDVACYKLSSRAKHFLDKTELKIFVMLTESISAETHQHFTVVYYDAESFIHIDPKAEMDTTDHTSSLRDKLGVTGESIYLGVQREGENTCGLWAIEIMKYLYASTPGTSDSAGLKARLKAKLSTMRSTSLHQDNQKTMNKGNVRLLSEGCFNLSVKDTQESHLTEFSTTDKYTRFSHNLSEINLNMEWEGDALFNFITNHTEGECSGLSIVWTRMALKNNLPFFTKIMDFLTRSYESQPYQVESERYSSLSAILKAVNKLNLPSLKKTLNSNTLHTDESNNHQLDYSKGEKLGWPREDLQVFLGIRAFLETVMLYQRPLETYFYRTRDDFNWEGIPLDRLNQEARAGKIISKYLLDHNYKQSGFLLHAISKQAVIGDQQDYQVLTSALYNASKKMPCSHIIRLLSATHSVAFKFMPENNTTPIEVYDTNFMSQYDAYTKQLNLEQFAAELFSIFHSDVNDKLLSLNVRVYMGNAHTEEEINYAFMAEFVTLLNKCLDDDSVPTPALTTLTDHEVYYQYYLPWILKDRKKYNDKCFLLLSFMSSNVKTLEKLLKPTDIDVKQVVRKRLDILGDIL